MNRLKGLILTVSIAVIATILGTWLPIIGSAIFAIVIGMIIGNIWRVPDTFQPRIKFSSKKVLHYSIIVLGFTLSFQSIGSVGWKSLPIIFITLIVAFLIVYLLLKLLHIDENIGILIGVGTSICGGSAIAATSPVIRAKESEVAFSISTVFLFNLIAVFIFPPMGHLFHMSQTAFGYFSGTAINDTSSVIAASSIYGHQALQTGAIVKLTRTLMIIPVVLFFAVRTMNKMKSKDANVSIVKIFPWFVVGFILASLISTVFNFSPAVIHVFQKISLFFISIAMAGIGLGVNFKQFKEAGFKPILLGLITWFVVIVSSLVTMWFTHLW
ncbi:YeiH family protein [Staphylococcus pettenkoferi]|uniref:YeiH family protein n=1 Tax=Staphylococcus pettenkoferi TaxID=170573 RepID=UPI002275EBDB|nr:YeiH family protein [Staphylococcus pettenkoferi]MCY1598133.1 YeiH family protein [Staphylococcus pettenkoferi]MCY1622802.1 YeiH family protein [Staphylococcus pettenkoferi]